MLFDNYKQIKSIIEYLRKPYDLLNDNHTKFIFSVGMPLFILFFLWFFGPFGLIIFTDIIKIKLISLYCIMGSLVGVSHFYWLQNIFIKRFTIGITIVWLVWINLVVGLSNFIIWEIIMNNGHMVWKGLPTMLFQTLLVGVLPILFIIILYNTFYLKRKIRVINNINSDLRKYQSRIPAKSDLTFTSTNLREVFTIDSSSLLYIASADNYVELFWLENGNIKKILLRKTLSEIEKEIKRQWQHIERCHNSYIVNINQIKSISGNSGGYRIILNGIDSFIPVSRKYSNIFFKLLN